jgi:hypothetical protein
MRLAVSGLTSLLAKKQVDDETLQKIIARRKVVWNYAVENLKNFPLSGVGVGNFVFWVKYSWFNRPKYHHLPSNQYLFLSSSIGLIGLFVFLFFLSTTWKTQDKLEKKILFVILLIIFFNHYLWFPESFLAFWLVASLGEKNGSESKPEKKKAKWFVGFLLILFVFSNIHDFNRLHPANWAKKTGTRYDYGFWYEEKDPRGQEFRWTKSGAGIYISLDRNGYSSEMKLFCGAPLERLAQREQRIEIFWKGKLYDDIVFRKNEDFRFRIKDKAYAKGLLEFRIYQPFNLNKMQLGEETRTLGIQVLRFDLYKNAVMNE